MIQEFERYEINGFFSFQISSIAFTTDPSVQTNRPFMSLNKPPPHHMTFKTSFKLLTIFAKIPILYASLSSELASDACISIIKQ